MLPSSAASQVLAGYQPYSAYRKPGSTYNPNSLYGRANPQPMGISSQILNPASISQPITTTTAAPQVTTPTTTLQPQITPITQPVLNPTTTQNQSWTQPSWWPSNTQLISDTWKSSGDPASGNVAQDWYRSPDWPGGGDIEAAVYNPYWGWQDMADVKALYRKAQGPVTQQQFEAWPLTQNTAGNWDQYFEKTAGGGGDGGGGGGTTGDPEAYQAWLNSLSTTGQTQNQDTATTADMLARFGYTGEIPINPMEQTYLNAINQLYTQEPTALQTMQPANQFYQDVLGGAVGNTGQQYLQNVYGATAAGALQNYGNMQRQLAEKFSQRGGYFGGTHSMAQAQLANQTNTSLNELLANLNQTNFTQDVAARQAAASGLQGLGTAQQGVSSQILSDLAAGGNLVTQRDITNRAELQQAQGLAYQDWLRAQQEGQQPFNYAMQLLGYQPYQNFAAQPQASPWGQILGSLITAGGQVGAAAAKKTPSGSAGWYS